MKWNVIYSLMDPDKKGKAKKRQMVIEAVNQTLALEWAEKQAEHWGKKSSFNVSPFVEEKPEVEESPVEEQ